jgi:hypothetical protein
MKNDRKIDEKRRGFLKLATLAPAAAVVAGSGGEAEAAETPGRAAGLRKTEHVRKYFETARF